MLQIKDSKVGKCWFSIFHSKLTKLSFQMVAKNMWNLFSFLFYLPDYDQSHNMHTDIIMINRIYMHIYVCVVTISFKIYNKVEFFNWRASLVKFEFLSLVKLI